MKLEFFNKMRFAFQLLLLMTVGFAYAQGGERIVDLPLTNDLAIENTNDEYSADLDLGLIGVYDEKVGDSPSDNVFHITIDKEISKTDQVYLTYELFGVDNISSVSRSINDEFAIGGFLQKKELTWHKEEELINTELLKKGKNSFVFGAYKDGFPYKIKNLKIVVKHNQELSDNAIFLSSSNLLEQGGKVYVRGFVSTDIDTEDIKVFSGETALIFNGKEFEGLVDKKTIDNLKISIYHGKKLLSEKVFTTIAIVAGDKLMHVDKSNAVKKHLFKMNSAAEFSFAGASIMIGDSVLNADKEIYIAKMRNIDLLPLNAGMINLSAGNGFRFLPDGTTFDKEVLLRIPFDKELIPNGYSAKDIRTFYFDKQTKKWVMLKIKEVDEATNTVISYTTHFTDYINGIIKAPESPQTSAYTPTSMSGIKAASPLTNITTVSVPNVSQDGSVNTSYPIKIPSGRNGMQPNLAIQYNSELSNGLLGLGWNLSISSIHLDTRWGVPSFDQNKETEIYALDGQTLMYPKMPGLTSGTWEDYMPNRHRGDNDIYTTEKQLRSYKTEGNSKRFTFRKQNATIKVERLGNSPRNYYWKVTLSNGYINWYGGDEHGICTNAIVKNEAGNVVKWALYRSVDKHGNYVKYSYDNRNISGLAGHNRNLNGGHIFRIKQIQYTLSSQNNSLKKYQVDFQYETSVVRQDVNISYRNGLKEITPYRMKEILVKYDNIIIRKYKLGYEMGEFKKSLLWYVAETDKDNKELSRQKFKYYDLEIPPNEKNPVIFGEGYVVETSSNADFFHNFNNLLKLSPLNTSQGFGGSFSARIAVGLKIGKVKHTEPLKNIMAGMTIAGSVSESTGKVTTIDIDGDALDDIVYKKFGTLYYKKHLVHSDGTHYFATFESPIYGLNDFEYSESLTWQPFFRSFDLSIGVSKFKYTRSKTITKSKQENIVYFVDGNKDGLLDIAYNGVVVFNHLDANGHPQFTVESAPTENMLITADRALENNPDTELEDDLEEMKYDVSRVWIAPNDGSITISDQISLSGASSSDATVLYTVETKKARRVIRWNWPWYPTFAIEDGPSYRLYANALSDANTNANVNLNQVDGHPIYVKKGQMVFFRAHSTSTDTSGVIESNPHIQFHRFLSNYQHSYDYNGDFTLSAASGARIPLPIDTLSTKTYRIYNAIAGTAPSGMHYTIKKHIVDVDGNDTTTTTLLSSSNLVSINNITVAPNQHVELELSVSSSNTTFDWSSYHWEAQVRTTPDNNLIVNATPHLEIYGIEPNLSHLGSLYQGWGQFSYKANLTGSTLDLINPNEVRRPNQPFAGIGATNEDQLLTSNGIDPNTGAGADALFDSLSSSDFVPKTIPMYPVRYYCSNSETNRAVSFSCEKWVGVFPNQFSSPNHIAPGDVFASVDDMIPDSSTFVLDTSININTDANTAMFAINTKTKSLSRTRSHAFGIANILSANLTNSETYNDGRNKAYEDSRIISSFMDFNGDGYPDIYSEGRIQYTEMTGGHKRISYSNGIFNVLNSTNNGLTVAASGLPLFVSKSTTETISIDKVDGDNKISISQSKQTDQGSVVAHIGAGVSIDGDAYSTLSWKDLNGDGLPDRIKYDGSSYTVEFNKGYAIAGASQFSSIEHDYSKPGLSMNIGVSSSASQIIESFNNNELGNASSWGFSYGIGLSRQTSKARTMYLDINSDGLSDIVYKEDNHLYVRYNLGNRFDNEVKELKFSHLAADGNIKDNTSRSTNVSFNGNVNGYFGIPIFWSLRLKLGASAGTAINYSVSESEISYKDFDGDGYLDIVVHLKGTDKIMIFPSLIGKANRLKGASIGSGDGHFEVDYTNTQPTYENPSTKWVMTTLTISDGLNLAHDGEDVITKYFEYEDGYYDRRERLFYGFETVKTIDKDESDNVYRTQITTYNNDNFFLKGTVAKTTVIKGATPTTGNIYNETINTYSIHTVNSDGTIAGIAPNGRDYDKGGKEGRRQGAVQLETTTTKVYELGNDPISSTTSMKYDSHGRVVSYVYTNNDLGNNYLSSISYADNAQLRQNNIWSIAENVRVRDGGTLLRERKVTDYNSATGTVREVAVKLNGTDWARTSMKYDSYGNLIHIWHPENAGGQRMSYEYTYGAMHKYVIRVKDAFGYQSSTEYDPKFDVVVQSIDITDNKMQYRYDSFGRMTSVTGPNELAAGIDTTISFEYYPRYETLPTDLANCFSPADIFSPVAITKHYDPIHPDNTMDTYTFTDHIGRAVQVKKDIEVDGHREQMSVSGITEFDRYGRAIKSYLPTAEDKDKCTNIKINRTPSNYYSHVDLDVLDRAYKSYDPAGRATETQFAITEDPSGNRVLETYMKVPQNGSTLIEKYSYTDIQGRKTFLKDIGDAGDLITQFTYNTIGQLEAYIDNDGVTTTYKYDEAGRVTHKESPNFGQVNTKYDKASNVIAMQTAVLAAEDKWVNYLYDYNRVANVVFPVTDSSENISDVSYRYGAPGTGNQSGRLEVQWDASGEQVFYYDRLGNVTARQRQVMAPNMQTFVFIERHNYDTWGRLLDMTYSDGEVLTYDYDLGGNINHISGIPADTSEPYEYVKAVHYNHFGERIYIKYGNDTETSYNYDPVLHRMENMTVGLEGREYLNNNYKFDYIGNVTKMWNEAGTFEANKMLGRYHHEYKYDKLNRLEHANGDFNGDNGVREYGQNDFMSNYDLTMEYSNTGRILRKTQEHIRNEEIYHPNTYNNVYEYGDAHRLKEVLDVNTGEHQKYEYDRNGNTTYITKNYDAGVPDQQMFWDESNRLRVVASTDGTMQHYIYDAAGERVLKSNSRTEAVYENGQLVHNDIVVDSYTMYPSGNTVVDGATYTNHYYLGSSRIATRVGTGDAYHMYNTGRVAQPKTGKAIDKTADKAQEAKLRKLQKQDLQSYMAKAGIKVTFAKQEPKQSDENAIVVPFPYPSSIIQLYFYHPDHLGTATLLTDYEGKPYQFFLNLPFGEDMAAQHAPAGDYSTRYKFNGKELDQVTGLYYYGARYYDPKISTWLSVDPLAEQYQPYSPYNYTLNNPINLIDPDGRSVKKGEGWTRKKGTKKWTWDENVHGEKDVKAGYEYGGKTKSEVRKKYNKWYSFYGQEFDDGSRFSPFIKKMIEEKREQMSTVVPLTEEQKKDNERIRGSLGDEELHTPTYPCEFLFKDLPPALDKDFDFSIEINGRKISGKGGSNKALPNIYYIDRIQSGSGFGKTVHSGFNNNSLLFGNKTKKDIIIILLSKENHDFILNYIRNGN